MTVRSVPGFRPFDRPGGPPEAIAARAGRDWCSIENKTDDQATVRIYDEIGMWGTTAADFANQVAALDVKAIDLRLNSPGGSVFDGTAIYNTLASHKARVDVTVDGVAASIASVIAMAGDSVTMGRGARMMIHNPSGLVLGNASDMREMANLLDMLAEDIAGFYAARAGGDTSHWLAAMAAETWYSAQEAVDAGLADGTLAPAEGAPSDHLKTFDLRAYGFRYADREHAPDPAALARTHRSDAVKARVRDTLRGVESE